MPASTLRLLGAFTLETPAGPVRPGRKGCALLAYAAAHGEAGAGRSALTTLLWGEHGEDDARNALRQCLHQIRRSIGDAANALDAAGDRIVLRDAACDVDVRRFERLAATDDPAAWLAAAALYRGDFLEGASFDGDFDRWAAAERERLRDVAHDIVARLAERAADAAACDAAIALGRRLLLADPVHEGCYRALMRLHARLGRRAKALQLWDECRRTLRRELDVEPSAATAALMHELRGAADGAPAPPRLQARAGDDAAVYDLVLRGWQRFHDFSAESNVQARAAFEAAVARAPDHAEAISMLGWIHWFDAIGGWSADSTLSYRLATHFAARALACDPRHPMPHGIQGKVLLWRMQHDAALEHLRRAVELAPDSAYAHFNVGDATMWCGRHGEAIAHVRRALELQPNEHGVFLTIEGRARWLLGDLDRAHAVLTSAITRNPGYSWAYGVLASVQAERGEIDAARDAAATARRLNRRFSLAFAEQVLPCRLPQERRRLVETWRAAGMPLHEAPGGRPVAAADAATNLAPAAAGVQSR